MGPPRGALQVKNRRIAPPSSSFPTLSDLLFDPSARTRFWKAHRRTILIGAGVVGVGVLGYGAYCYWEREGRRRREEEEERRLLRRKAQQEQWEEQQRRQQELAEQQADEQLQAHFDSIQTIADTTTLPSVVPHLKTRLFALVDLSSFTQALMAHRARQSTAAAADNSGSETGSSTVTMSTSTTSSATRLDPTEKFVIWENLKVLSFCRTLGAMWALALLQLFIRTQLNVLGRHVYMDTASSGSSGHDIEEEEDVEAIERGAVRPQLSMACQHRFIAFADYLPHRGLSSLLEDARATVGRVLQTRSLRERLSLPELRTLLFSSRAEFESTHADQWERYLLPPTNDLPHDLAAASSVADGAHPNVGQRDGGREDREEEGGDRVDGAVRGGGEGGGGRLREEDSRVLDQLMTEVRQVLRSVEFRETLSAMLDALTDGAVQELWQTAFSLGRGDATAAAAATAPDHVRQWLHSTGTGSSPHAAAGGVPGWTADGGGGGVAIALAKLLPPVAGVSASLLESPEGNPYLARLSALPELRSFSAMVYASPALGSSEHI